MQIGVLSSTLLQLFKGWLLISRTCFSRAMASAHRCLFFTLDPHASFFGGCLLSPKHSSDTGPWVAMNVLKLECHGHSTQACVRRSVCFDAACASKPCSYRRYTAMANKCLAGVRAEHSRLLPGVEVPAVYVARCKQ